MKQKYNDDDILRGMDQRLEEYKLLLKGLQEAVSPQWIPVVERLPDVKIPADFDRQTYSDFGKCFLMTDRRGFVYTATFHVIANKFDLDAVAWMPLPEPYKNEEAEEG